MPDGRTVTATCRRVGSGWEVHVPALDVAARADGFADVERVARELMRAGEQTEGPGGSTRVVVLPLVPPRVLTLLASAERVRGAPDSVRVDDVMARRRLARALVDEGFDVADVAWLLGVSEGRVRRLTVGMQPAPAPTSSPPVLPTTAQSTTEGIRHVEVHRSNRHEALLHRGDSDFLAQAVPFLRDGVALGQPVLAAVPGPRLDSLRHALGADATHVHLVDMAEVASNPARLLPAWLGFLDEHGGRGPVRGLGQPLWPGRSAAEVAESHLHEALLNVAVHPDTPAWLRCAYDEETVGSDVLDEVLCSHPLVVDGGEPRGSIRYGGLTHVEELFGAPLPEPEARTTAVPFGRGDLAEVRALVSRWSREAGLGRDRTADLVLAVAELATNSIRHGGGSGRLRSWREEGALVVEVTDRGEVTDRLAGRRAPDWSLEGGRGLWLAHQLCDVLQLRSGPRGTTARAYAHTSR